MTTITASAAAALNVSTTAPVAVADTATAVTTYLTNLQNLAAASKLTSIALTGAGTQTLSLTPAQLVADSAALLKISGSYAIAVSGQATAAQAAAVNGTLAGLLTSGLVVSDTAANVQANLAGLQARAIAGKLASVTLTDAGTPALTLTAALLVADSIALLKIGGNYSITLSGTATAAQAAAINSTLAAKIANGLAVSDTAANVVTNLAGLQTRAATGKLASVTLTDAGTPALTLTAAQLAADATALLKIGGNYGITISGPVTASQATTINSTLAAKITNGLAVSDTAANVVTNLAGLQTRAATGTLASITLTDAGTPALTLTATQLTADATALLKIGGNYSITLSGVTTAAQATAINSTLAAKIANGLAVSDTAANVVANLAGLQTRAAAGKLASVTLTDAGTPALTLTAAQLVADATALLKISGNYSITLSGTATASLAALANTTLVAKVTGGFVVSDTAANVSGNLDALEALAVAGKLTSITLTDSGTPVLHLTAAQVIAYTPMLAKVVGNYGLDVTTSATAAQAVAIPSTLLAKLTANLTVSDTAANIVPKLDGLQTLYAAGKLSSVSISDATALSVTAATLAADNGVLAAINGPYTLTVASGTLTVAQAISLNSGTTSHLGNGLAVSDTAAAVGSSIDALQALGATVSSIALTDGGISALALTATQLVADAATLQKVSGGFGITLSGALTVAQAQAAAAQGLLARVTGGAPVSDTAANVTAGLDALQALGGSVASIGLTDGGTPALSLTATQLAADGTTLGKIGTPYSVTLSGTLTVAQAQSAAAQGLLARVTGGAPISDTAAHVQGALGALLGLGNQVASIALSDTATPTLSVIASDLVADAAALAKITSAYHLSVSTGTVTAAQAIALNSGVATHLAAGLAVADTAGNITAALAGLQTLGATVAAITLTDGGTPALALTAAQLVADAATLLKIGGGFGITVSGNATAAQAAAANSALLARLTNAGLLVADSAAAVTAQLDGLQANASRIAAITLTDAGTPTLSVSAATLLADTAALGAITSAYNLAVASGTLTTAQVATLNAVPAVASHLTASVTVSDTAANIVAHVADLASLGAALAAITLTDAGTPTLSLTAAQLVASAALWLKIAGSYGIAVSGTATAAQAVAVNSTLAGKLTAGLAVLSTAADVDSNLDALQGRSASVASIALTDGGAPALALTAAQLVADAPTLLKISGNYALTLSGSATAAQAAAANSALVNKLSSGLAVSDSAANVAANLNGLQGLAAAGKLASVALTDAGTPTLSVSAATLAADAAALALIGGNWTLGVSAGSVTAAQAIALGSAVTSRLAAGLTVADSAANVTASLAGLQALGNTVASIALTDTGAVPVLSLTPAQMIADAATLLKIGSPCNISVSGAATAAQAASVATPLAQKILSGFVVSDSAANVATYLDGLQARDAATELASISLTDSGTPTLAVTATQLNNDAATLALVSGAWHLSVASGSFTAAQALALNSGVAAHLTTGLAVSDSAANVAANLNGLQGLAAAGKLASVALTDAGTPTLSVSAATLAADAAALALIGGNWTLGVSAGSVTAAQAIALGSAVTSRLAAGLTVADSAANVTASLAGLQALGNTVASIALTDTGAVPVLSLTPAQMIADAATLLKIGSPCNISVSGAATAAQAASVATPLAQKILSGFVVSDSAANVATYLDGLQARDAATELASISLTDSGTPTLAVTATQLNNDAATLALVSGAWHLSVASGSFTAAQALALNSGVAAHLTTGLAVSDSAANAAASLNGLQALGSTVASVALTGSPASFAVTADQLWHDAGILGKISASGVTLAADTVNPASAAAAANLGGAPAFTGALLFNDSAANVAANLDSLQALASAGHLGGITLSNAGTPTLAITAAQLNNDAGALAMIGGSYAVSVSGGSLTAAQALAIGNTVLGHLAAAVPVSDSSANIVANLAALQARAGALASVSFSDGTPTLSLTPAQLTGGIGVLSLASGYNLSVSGTLTAAQAATLSPTSVVSHLTTGPVVSDSAANIAASLAALMTLANASKLGSITLTDGGTPTLGVTPAQLSGDVAVLRKITSNYVLAPTTALTADQATSVSSLLVGKLTPNLAVTDTAADVLADLDGLELLAADNHLGSVTLTDTGTPVFNITANRLNSDAAALNKITSSYQLNIMGGITVAQAVAYASNTGELATSVHVVDAASAVASNMPSLQTLAAAGKLGSIAFTDSGTPNLALAATVFAASAAALGAIIGNYAVTLTGTLTVAQTQAAATAGLLAHVTGGAPVGDTAANVQAALDALKLLGNAVASITLTDGGTPTITVSAATLLADTSVLALIAGNWHLSVSSGTLTVAQATGLSPGVTGHLTTGLNVSDTAASVAGAIDALQTLGSVIASIALTDASPVLSLTSARFLADAATLLKISGAYGITLSGAVTASQAVGANSTLVGKLTAGLAVSDTAANVVTSLGGLQSLATAGKLASVALTDAGTPTLSMTTATLTADAAALALIGGSWNLAITSGTVTAAQATALSSAVTTHLSAGLVLSDSAANIASSLNVLQGLGVAVASIALTDSTPSLTLTAAQLVNDAATLAKISSTYQIVLSGSLTVAQATQAPIAGLVTLVSGGVSISDTAAAVQAALGTLQSLGNHVASITLSDSTTPTLSITTAMVIADAATLAKITSAYHLSVSTGTVTVAQAIALSGSVTGHLSGGLAVSDTAAAVGSSIDALQALGATVSSIALTDGGISALALTATQLVADAATLQKVSGGFGITLSGALTVAQAQAAAAQGLLARVTGGAPVSDTAANVTAGLDALQALGGSVASIGLTDGGTPALSLTATQLAADGTTLGKIGTPYSVTLSGTLTVAQAQSAAAQGLLARVTGGAPISDTAAHVQGALGALLGLGNQVASIALSDTATPTLSVIASDLVADAAALAKITSAYHLSVSTGTVTAAQAIALNSGVATHLAAGLAVADTAGNITAALAGLQTLGATVAAITLTDGGTPALALTAAQLVADAATLLKIGGGFGITVSGNATAAQAAAANSALLARLTNAGLLVADSAAAVTAQLDGLQANASRIAAITLTDAGTPTLSVSAATLLADTAALGAITSAYNLAVASGTLTTAQVATLNAVPAVASHLTASVTVSDTAANIVAHVADLASLGAALAAITLTDAGTPTLSLTAAQLVASAALWLKIAGSYGIAVSGTATAAQAVAVNSTLAGKLTAGLAVLSTAADVDSNLDALQGRSASVASIALTDGGAPALALTAAQLVADAPTLLKISGNYALTLSGSATAAQAAAANSALVNKLSSGLAVSDSAANVAANLNGLQGLAAAGKLASVALTDAGTPTLSVSAATLAADAAALALIGGNWTLGVSAGSVTAAQAIALGSAVTSRLAAGLTVADSAANVTASLAGLQALGNTVASIALTDTGAVPVLSLTPAQMIADAATLLKIGSPCNISVSGAATAAQAASVATPLAQKILSGFVVSDSAANVATYLDGLQARDAATELASISLTDSGTPTLAVTATQLNNDAATLALVSGAWHLSVASGSFTAAQALALNSGVAAHLTTGLAVSDSAANAAASLNGLQALGSTVASVALTGSPASFAVTADQLWHDAGILGKISASGVTLAADTVNPASAAAAANLGGAPAFTGALLFNDSAANVAANLDSLQALASAGHLGGITLSNAGTPTLAITAAQLNNDAGALAMIGGSYAVSVSGGSLTAAQALAIGNTVLGHLAAAVPVSDSSANIVANLAALQARAGALASVSFSDGTPTLSLTPAQLTGGIGVLSLASGYNLSVSGTLTAAQAATLSPTSVVSHLTTGPVVSDSAANIAASLAALMTLANASKLGSITLTDGGTPTLGVTPAQLSGDVAVLRKITSNYVLAPTTALTADQATSVSSLLVGKLTPNLAVTDTAAHVLNDLDSLETLAAGNHLGSVTLTDTGTPVLQLTGDQLTSDAAVLAEITGTYNVSIVGGITAAQAAAFAAHPTEVSDAVNVVDAASAVASNMPSLQTLAAAGKLGSIAFTDSGTPNLALAATVFAASAAALGAIIGNYAVTLTGTLTVAQTQAAATAGLLAHVTGGAPVGDTAANVQAALDALKLLGNAVASITLTDGGTPTITVSAATLLADNNVLALISGSNWHLSVTPGTLTVAQATGLSNTITSRLSPGLTVSDSVAHVTGSLAALQTLGAAIAHIALTDTSPVLSLTVTQFVNNAATLQKITGTYGIALGGALTVAQTEAAATQGLLPSVTGGAAISDTAAAVQAGLGQLHGYGSQVASITLTDNTTPTITVASTDLISDASTLALIGGTWNLTVTGAVTAAQATTLGSAVTAHLSPGLAVSDSAAQFAANIDALQARGSAVATVTLNDGGTPAVALTSTQLVADAATLQKVAPPFSITLTGTLSVAQAQTLQTQGLLTLVTNGATINDTAANVQAALGALLGLGNEIASVTLSDATTPTISIIASDLVADASVFVKITSPYHLTVSSGSVTAAQATGLSTDVTSHLTAGLAVSDNAASVTASLGSLQGILGKLASITLTDNSTPTISVTDADLVADAGALALIGGTWSLATSGTVTAAQALALPAGVTGRLASGLTLSDISANVVANLNALQGIGTTVLHITLTDSTPVLSINAEQLIADGTTLLKISTPYNITLSGSATAAQATAANGTLVGYLTTGFVVSDAAAAVTSNLDGLQTLAAASNLVSVTLTDASTPTLTVTAGTLVADAGALALIGGSWHLAISSGTVTAAQALALSAVTTHLTGGLAVLDSAASVSSNLDALQALGGTVASIALNDGGTPALTMTATRLVSDSATLLKVSGNFNISVSGDATAAQAAGANATLLGKLLASLTVNDSAANVTASLDGLQARQTHLASITLSDSSEPTITVTAEKLVADADALALIGSPYHLTVTGTVNAAQAVALNPVVTANLTAGLAVSDTAASVASNIDALQGLGSTLLSIALTDNTPSLSLTATQFLADADTLLKIGGAYSVTLSGALLLADAATASGDGLLAKVSGGAAISDSALNVQGGLDTLQGYGNQIASVALTDNSTPTITIDAATLFNDNATLAKISSAYDLTVSSGTLTAAQAAALGSSVLTHLTPASLAVSDDAAGVVASLDGLQARNASLASITLTDGGTPALAITAAQLVADAAALLLITPPFTITLSGTLTEAQAATANTQGLLALVSGGAAIRDTAANVQGSLDALQALGNKVASIALSDGGTPTISITSATLVADAAAAGKITSLYHLTIGGDAILAAQATGISAGIANHLTNGFTISDNTNNVTSSIGGLQTLAAGNHLASIALTDNGTVTLSAANVVADTSALTHVTGSWNLAVSSGVFTAAQAASLVTNGLNAALSGTVNVTDSAAHMTANLGALEQLSTASHLGTVTLTTAPSAFSVTVAQATSDVAAINAVMGATNANTHAVLYVNGASNSNGDTVDTSGINHAVNISLGGNSATMSFVGPAATISGTADNLTVGNAAGARIEDTISSGVEVVTGFQLGRDTLDLALNNADPSTLTVSDVNLGGTTAISLALSGDPTHGVILLNPGVNASSLQDDNIFAAGSHVLIS